MTDETENENEPGDADTANEGAAAGSWSPVGDSAAPTSALNQQIVQAVDKTNQVVIGSAAAEANGVAYQKVAQAAAFSVQDSTDYLRNIMTIAATAQGVCLQQMLEKEVTSPYSEIMTQAQAAVTAAQTNFASVGTSSAAVVAAFPTSE